MASSKQTVSFKAEPVDVEKIDAYAEREGYEHRSDAAKELVETGLREQSNPLVWRWKHRVVDWAGILGIAAIIVFLAGGATSVISVRDGAVLSLTFVSVAVLLLAGFEVVRVVLGINEVGEAVHARVGALVGVFRG